MEMVINPIINLKLVLGAAFSKRYSLIVIVTTGSLRPPQHIVASDESVRISCGELRGYHLCRVGWSAQRGIDSGVQIDGV